MRPAPDLAPFHRKPSLDHPSPSLDPRTFLQTPTAFFLSRNPDASDLESLASPSPTMDEPSDSKDSMYGVHSLGDSLLHSPSAASSPRVPPSDSHAADNDNSSLHIPDEAEELQASRRRSTLKPADAMSRDSPVPPVVPNTISRPLTPLNPDDALSLPGSSPRSVSNYSLRPLDDISITDDTNSQAVLSGDEDERIRRPSPSPHAGFNGASQFIMPSIEMPSRRPFTERGKAMGRFKVMIAGASGSGKTSLIKSIVHTCEDIVHIDPIDTSSHSTSLERRRSSRPHSGSVPTRGMPAATTEIYASTKPYPPWWSDLEDSRVLRRRKSIGEIILERNLCFVDTPAISLSRAGQTDAILQYMGQQFTRATAALSGSSVDLQNLLAGNGGSQVDAVLYLISNDTLSVDMECIRKLCQLSNVIPVIAKADTLSPEQIEMTKVRFHQDAQLAGVKPFLFGAPPEGLEGLDPQPPYTVSSVRTADLDVMDASTLMRSDYQQPLFPSDLEILVEKLFDREYLAWMRHSAAKKLVQRGGDFTAPIPSPMGLPTQDGRSAWRASSGMSLDPSVCYGDNSRPSRQSYAMARFVDLSRHEEQMAQVRLAHWATDLQRSLQNERDRYASLARGDRAVWLTEKLSECVMDGSLIPVSKTPGFCGLNMRSSEKMRAHADYHVSLSSHDPLGVVGWIDDLGRRGWVLVQIVGSVGVVGGLAFWLARTLGLPTRSLADLHLEHWYGGFER
ncbi:hypothetical protein N7532_006287 [Penicillium argentinense]|uniref:Septin-type G domain-containing protein n=1 Tax=Penicillium argentinense TaxID=1131581 RepID=A0A9W9KB70_9EURO|nr:uncharacterized protein N7532_006287 [Penicillium argentinense]KAJ5099286.1 hypothetical protein N7532_006287 [Penicillium argentinense]